jgi:xanthine dehydrogenase accessory factor
MQRGDYGRPAAIVIGAGEVGSAIAVALHRAGCGVVLTDEVDPAWPRRGMAFTNAWYIGNAELDGEAAVFCASLKSIPAVLDHHRAVAATSWSWAGIAKSFEPAVIVDASLRPPGSGALAGARDPGAVLTIGLQTAHSAEMGVDVVVECPPDEHASEARHVVLASRNGRFATSRRIGDRVAAGEVVGAVGLVPVVAPCDGALRGLSARGARVQRGAPIVEVDPRGEPVLCFGLDDRAAAIAREVLRAATQRGALPPDIAAVRGGDSTAAAVGA